MSNKEEDFLKKLRAIFAAESQERLQEMSSALLELEKMPPAERQKQLIDIILRQAHSLKGAARVVNMPDIEALSQSFEGVLSSLKLQTLELAPELFDMLHRVLDKINKLADFIDGEPADLDKTDILKLLNELAELEGTTSTAKTQFPLIMRESRVNAGIDTEKIPAEQETILDSFTDGSTASSAKMMRSIQRTLPQLAFQSGSTETQRIHTAKLNSLLLKGEELLAVKLAIQQRVVDLRDIQGMLEAWNKKWLEMDRDLRSAKQLLERREENKESVEMASPWSSLLSFMDWNAAYTKGLEHKIAGQAKAAETDRYQLSEMVDSLLQDTKQLLMLPFSTIGEALPKLVRDLSREQGKEIQLVITGGEIEIDKRILEEMKDALLHIMRNCIDHGIEKPEERERNGKPRQGTIVCSISQVDSNLIEIAISDDGAGMDLVKLRASAIKLEILTADEADNLDQQQLLQLAFRSEVSTNPIVTEISGRGLGLAIVQEKVEKLGGHVYLESTNKQGTRFRVITPLTHATFRGILVKESEQVFVIPMANVERVTRVKSSEIKPIENKETVILDQRTIALVRLENVLELQHMKPKQEHEFIQVLIISMEEKCIAFAVDEVLGDQEILAKTLLSPLLRVRNVAGATVLGSGKVAPILNVADLIKSAAKSANSSSKPFTGMPATEAKQKSILVVEDSITSRMLLQNILESAGYQVSTAVDGIDGLTRLRTEDFDLVISDVDMPRMSGFELTSKIRGDKKLSDIPVVLVTALASREDREKGADAGANAYIVKSTFDQSNLLEVVHRLL